MRGKQHLYSRVLITRRITPACAGKTQFRFLEEFRQADHPRVCGENHGVRFGGRCSDGSPPRVRGKRRPAGRGAKACRITPACAGKTVRRRGWCFRRPDHPRVCGENVGLVAKVERLAGSPPRVRGKLTQEELAKKLGRITPACAGKTRPMALRTAATPDHPRVCGENSFLSLFHAVRPGSPPRVRGKRPCLPDFRQSTRITPACAGKTCHSSALYHPHTDHPRVCGENRKFWTAVVAFVGSPPRVRGKLNILKLARQAIRITPACAGKTQYSSELLRRLSDHPRVCGENTYFLKGDLYERGSPPRVRGKLTHG